jgi:formate-dependent phosphoribosylglycinamide formyltransferase (GAR transformylase)
MCWLEPGMEIRPVQVDGDRKGFAIAAGETVEEAVRRADDALGRIRVRTAP